MNRILKKSLLWEIKKNIGRYISIFAIVAIGIGFFAGVRATKSDMISSADKYYSSQNLMDLRILSVDGFKNDDIELITEQTGANVEGAYYCDCVFNVKDNDAVGMFYSICDDINNVKVVKGRLPKSNSECVALSNSYKSNVTVGDKIVMSGDNSDRLKNKQLTVVGLVDSAMYISGTQFGTTGLGNGQIATVFFMRKDAFNLDLYNQLYVYCDFLHENNTYSDKYKNSIKDITSRLDAISKNRMSSIKDGSYDYRRLNLGRYDSKLADAVDKVYTSKEELAKISSELTVTKGYIDRAGQLIEKKLRENQIGSEQLTNEVSAELVKYREQMEAVFQLKSVAEGLKSACDELQKQYDDSQNSVNEAKTALDAITDTESDQYKEAKQIYDDSVNKSNDLKKQLDDKTNEYKNKQAEYEEMNSKYDSAYSAAKETYDKLSNDQAISSEDLMLMTIKQQASLVEYNAKVEQYNIAKGELDLQLPEIINSVSTIYSNYDKLWYVYDRSDLPANAEYGENSERIGNISRVFPVLFLAVAMLVCLTAMTRMVDEQRTDIGVLKALGYSNGAIIAKYLTYALSATVLGCITGLLIGFQLFPRVIMAAYSILYKIPVTDTPFKVGQALTDSAVMCICMIIAVMFACHNEFTNSPNDLMRPKTPATGKKIFLERFGFIWKHLSFKQKISARNIFRYKKRMLMSLIGTAGCTALLITGFGLKDSITDIIGLQFSNVLNYDFTVNFTDDEAVDQLNDESVDDYIICYEKQCTAEKGEKKCDEVLIISPDNSTEFDKYFSLKSRIGGSKYSLSDDGCIVTEKLAKLLDIKEGDTFKIKFEDNKITKLKVKAIVENYVYHYVYLSDSAFSEAFGEKPDYNTAFCMYSGDNIDEFSEKLLQNDSIVNISVNSNTKDSFSDIVKILNLVVIVLIISAAALSFVVLYSLSNVNITERKREIATLKVLGFNQKEVAGYVFRENIVISLMGTAVGLVCGYFLAMYVIITAEIDMVMFGRSIHLLSFVYATVLSILFSVLSSLFTRKKLNSIDMIESLKSVE